MKVYCLLLLKPNLEGSLLGVFATYAEAEKAAKKFAEEGKALLAEYQAFANRFSDHYHEHGEYPTSGNPLRIEFDEWAAAVREKRFNIVASPAIENYRIGILPIEEISKF